MRVPPTLRRFGDPLLALALAGTMTAELLVWDPPDQVGASVLLGLLATLPLTLRRRLPFVSFVLAMLGLKLLVDVTPGFDNDSLTFVAAFLLALYSVGRHAAGPEAWLGAAGVLAAMVDFYISDGSDLGDVAFVVAFVGSPYAAGLTIRLRREREAVLRGHNDQLRAEQEELARRAVTEERSRIARELHDVVSHAISVTVLQARGARRQLGVSEVDVRRALDAIEQTNTAALSDMRRLLAVLRDTEDDAVTDGHNPQPSLAQLDTLARRVTESGVPVSLEIVGETAPVPPGVDLSAYRIVQEALTNVLKHAGPASATVVLDYRPGSLVVRVRDTGKGTGHAGGPSTGRGLIGIRERVAVVGGEVTASPCPDGGFELTARLPFALETP